MTPSPFSARKLLARVGVRLTSSRRRDEAADRDTAERQHLEEKVQALKALLADVERLAHLGRWEMDLRGGPTYWSDEVYRILGLAPGSCLPSREAFLEAVVPEDRQCADEAAGATASDGVTRRVEFRIMTAQGAVRWIDGTVELVRDRDGRPARISGTVQDITERQRADDALRESDARFRTMADCAPAMLWVADKDGNSQFVNRAYCDFFGKSLKEVEGAGWRPLLHPEDAAAYIQAFFTAMRDRTPFYALTRAQRHDGEWRWLESYGALRFTPSGEFLGVVGTTLDITRRKQAEELAARAAEFERSNIEAQLAKDAAEMANRAKSVFLANMSHELRTPLNAVLGYAQILQRDADLSASAANGVETIRRGGEQLLTLVNEVLDMARIEAGKIDLYPDAVSLASVLRSVTDTVRVNALEKGLRFDVDDAADLPAFVHADEKRLGQVLLNLLSNAVKFTERGGVQLRTRCLGLVDANVRVRFEVVDSGIGIAEEQQATIFLPFEQVSHVQRRFGGTGLGLAISRQLVRLMGSDIRVESRLGQGSRFWFDVDLPIAHAPPPVDSSGEQRIITGYLGPRRKMLVVDDVAGNRAIMVDFLAPLGFEVIEADNGEKGLEQAAAMAP
ncbi:MAG TPA: PAS domain S-box protein, partial [Albitalea sp.]|nr:PAS domain S-box protein [Albitalea sp.]